MKSYDQQAELLKAMAHPVRLQILDILHEGEQCVCHIEAMLNLRQAYVSQQLVVLRKANLVLDRKDGLRVYYRLTDPAVLGVMEQARTWLERQGVALDEIDLTPRDCPCPKCSPTTLTPTAFVAS
jgi:DNA-binding transcriptional ArsR family regulator